PLLTRDGKEGCVGCHAGKGGGALRFSGNPDKDFVMLLRDGFFLKDDAGSLLERVADRDVKRRMPPNRPAWPEADVKVLRTFVNTPATSWQLHTSASPQQGSFAFRPAQDGEYWFSVVTVDTKGGANPADVSREPPAVVVVVDTQPPQFTLQPWTAPTNEVCLR